MKDAKHPYSPCTMKSCPNQGSNAHCKCGRNEDCNLHTKVAS